MKPDAPPSHLKATARQMWEKLRRDHVIDDAGGLALLQAACEAFQRAQEAREAMAKSGTVAKDRFGQDRASPWVTIERDARGQMISALRALRLAPGADES